MCSRIRRDRELRQRPCEDQVPVRIARERNRILRDLAAEKKLAFMRTFVGKTVEAITLNVFDGESTEALTDNYLKVRLQGQHEANRWMKARVEQVESGADRLAWSGYERFGPVTGHSSLC